MDKTRAAELKQLCFQLILLLLPGRLEIKSSAALHEKTAMEEEEDTVENK